MPIPTSRATRYRKSLSSLLTWSRHNSIHSIGPIIFEDDDAKVATERCREIQLTLDKLEGRLIVSNDGDLTRASIESSNEICGLMSMLGHTPNVHNDTILKEDRESSFFGQLQSEQHISEDQYGYAVDGATDGTHGPKRPFDHDKYITHPAFGFPPRGDRAWDTTSRISDDSLFDDHERQNPGKDYTALATNASNTRHSSCIQKSPFLRPIDRLWSHPESVLLKHSFQNEPATIFDSITCIGDSFFEPSYLDRVGNARKPSAAHSQQSVNHSSIGPLLLNKGSSPLKMAGIQQKSSFIKRMLNVVAKPLKVIGNFKNTALVPKLGDISSGGLQRPGPEETVQHSDTEAKSKKSGTNIFRGNIFRANGH